MANNPEIPLLDEPPSALDNTAKLAIESVLTSLIAERNLTCIWVTHDRSQARRLAGKVLTPEGGWVQAFHGIEEERHD